MTLGEQVRYGEDAVTTNKLTSSEVRAIRGQLADGAGQSEVARLYGVSRSCISDLARRKTWDWVNPG